MGRWSRALGNLDLVSCGSWKARNLRTWLGIAGNCGAARNLGSFDVLARNDILRNVGLGHDCRCHN